MQYQVGLSSQTPVMATHGGDAKLQTALIALTAALAVACALCVVIAILYLRAQKRDSCDDGFMTRIVTTSCTSMNFDSSSLLFLILKYHKIGVYKNTIMLL